MSTTESLYEDLLEEERIKRALEAETHNAEKSMHLFNRAYVLNQPVFEELHPALRSCYEANSEHEAQEEVNNWNEIQSRL